MIRSCLVSLTIILAMAMSPNTAAAQGDGWRTIEFETTEVTAPHVALSPDGEWLIFSMLGHLFRLPVEGGDAEQLTFGPYYDTDLAISPDGNRVAFVSDRDGSEGNIFVLELATGEVTQVTHESWAGQPTWSPDGRSLVYLSIVREASTPDYLSPALVRSIPLGGGQSETLSTPPQSIQLGTSVFHLPDGRLAWTIVEQAPGSQRLRTRIEATSHEGVVSTIGTLGGIAYRVVSNAAGDGLYYSVQRNTRNGRRYELMFAPLPDGDERPIVLLPERYFRGFAVTPDDGSLYMGEWGQIWNIELPSGDRQPVPFRARVKLEVQDPVPPPKWSPAEPGSSLPPRSVLNPRLSPDGRTLVFGAAGYLWRQPLGGGPPRRLFQGSALERSPAFSSDGRRLAYVHRQFGTEEVRVLDLETSGIRTLASGLRYGRPSWSEDGQRLVFSEREGRTRRLVAVDLDDGTTEHLTDFTSWIPRPHFSADGRSVYFTAKTTGTASLYRFSLESQGQPEPMTELARDLSEALVSPDGQRVAFRRGTEIWVGPLGSDALAEQQAHRLSTEGGETFAFTPDGSALVYSAGNRVWRHQLTGDAREEIPIRLELQRPTAPPLLLRRVRVLDFTSGGFSEETSLFVERGRIRWVGAESGRTLPSEIVIIDANGRLAMPGLFDLHGHLGASRSASRPDLDAFVAYGVTSTRDPGGWLAFQNALRDRSEATTVPMPRSFFFSGDLYEGALPIFGDAYLQIYNEEQARAYVRRWKERGAQFIKVYYSLPWPLQRAVADEARRLGLPVAGHARPMLVESVTLGYASLEHGGTYYDDVLQLLAAAGTRWVPTLVHLGGNVLVRDEPERLEDPKLRAFRGRRVGTANDSQLRQRWADLLAVIRAAQRRGVKLLAGTDYQVGSPGIPGASLHWELEFFVEAGIAPLEVLRIATQEAAAAVGAGDDLGTLEIGKLADIVLLDANPLEDIKNTQRIWRVIKGGFVFDPEALRPERN